MVKKPSVIRHSELLHSLVFDRLTTDDRGRVERLWMYPQAHRVLGFICKQGLMSQKRWAFTLPQIKAINDKNIWVQGDATETDVNQVSQLETLMHHEVWSESGAPLGRVKDCLFELKTGKITQYLVALKGWRSLLNELYPLSPKEVLSFGRKRILVSDRAMAELQNQRDRLQQALKGLKRDYETLREEFSHFSQQAQTVTQATVEKTVRKTVETFRDLGEQVGEHTQELAQDLVHQTQHKAQDWSATAQQVTQQWVDQVKAESETWIDRPFPSQEPNPRDGALDEEEWPEDEDGLDPYPSQELTTPDVDLGSGLEEDEAWEEEETIPQLLESDWPEDEALAFGDEEDWEDDEPPQAEVDAGIDRPNVFTQQDTPVAPDPPTATPDPQKLANTVPTIKPVMTSHPAIEDHNQPPMQESQPETSPTSPKPQDEVWDDW